MQFIIDSGPITIKVSIICCDAIIIMSDQIHRVPLVDLSRAIIEQKILIRERGTPDVLDRL